jgi:hypothetical protein
MLRWGKFNATKIKAIRPNIVTFTAVLFQTRSSIYNTS